MLGGIHCAATMDTLIKLIWILYFRNSEVQIGVGRPPSVPILWLGVGVGGILYATLQLWMHSDVDIGTY